MRQLIRIWTTLNEWIRAFVLAFLFLLLVHLFVFRWVTVQSTSMYATLLPGDLVLVERWPVWTGFQRGDVVVFRDPLQDRNVSALRTLLVKRIAGMPGDTVELRAGKLFVNGSIREAPLNATQAFLVRLRDGADIGEMLGRIGLPDRFVQQGRSFIELPLNVTLAESLEQFPGIVSAEAMSTSKGSPLHIFPFSRRYAWNSDDYGPIIVPAQGDTLRITMSNLPLYDRLIGIYEHHELSTEGNVLLMDGSPLDRYIVEQDHYFMLGDSRHHSADSRYWGFVPHDHMVGRAARVIIGKGSDGSTTGRFWSRP